MFTCVYVYMCVCVCVCVFTCVYVCLHVCLCVCVCVCVQGYTGPVGPAGPAGPPGRKVRAALRFRGIPRLTTSTLLGNLLLNSKLQNGLFTAIKIKIKIYFTPNFRAWSIISLTSTPKRPVSGRLRYGHVSLPGTFSLSSYGKSAQILLVIFVAYEQVLFG